MKMKRMTAGLLALLILTSTACTSTGDPKDTEGTTDVGATEAPTETEAEESTTAPEDVVVTPPSVSLDQLTFTPASPEGQVLTEKGHSPQIIIRNYNETATDALGRVLPTSGEAGLPKEGKYVGLFYSLWTVGSTCDVDNSKVMAVDPYDPDFGPRWGFCWWTEPETGYHRGDDVWQIRRDLYYFAMAGIDFLYFDLTNGYLYEDAMEVFLDTCLQMRAEGQMTPYLVPWCFGTAIPGHGDTGRFYERFMTEEKYRDLWFHWEGKPLALVKCLDDGSFPILEDEYYKDKLTFRKAWVMPDARASKLYWCDNNIVNFGYGYGYTDKRTRAECAGGDPHLVLKGDWEFYCSAVSNSKLSFASDFASNATGIALGNTDLASFFTLGLNFSSKGTSASSYILDGRSEMYTDLNGAYAMTYRFADGCEDTWYAFVRGAHAVVAKDAPTPHVSSYFEKDGSADGIGGAGIYARIEKGILELVMKVYDRAAGTHIQNVSYEIPCNGTELTLADSGDTVYVMVDGVTYATVELSGNVSYDVFSQISPATGFAETAKVTLKDGRTDTLTDTLIDSDRFTQGGLTVRAGTVCFDSVVVSEFSDAVIPEMETASGSKE